jgi:hypothetical protein
MDNSQVLMQNILNSINTWKSSLNNINHKKYVDCLVNQLWEPIIDFSLTTPYILLNFLKPFHTELILDNAYKLSTYGDKFNSVWIDNLAVFNYQSAYTSGLLFDDFSRLNPTTNEYDKLTPSVDFETLLSLRYNEKIDSSSSKAIFNSQLSSAHSVLPLETTSTLEILDPHSDNLPIHHLFEVVIN